MTLGTGTRLGPYEILDVIGAGGMGEVYRAKDLRLGREVAVKVLPTALSAVPDRLRRFAQEARAAAALNHPNILAVYDVGTAGEVPYIVSELLEGETLRHRLDAGSLLVRKAIDFAMMTLGGLSAAHDKGIVHRDLKPENLFVTKDDRIKILDFGLAKLTEADTFPASATDLSTTSAETKSGIILGTVGYMAPEQARGQKADHRADIFAFGAILYEMLAAKRAFHGETPADTITAILMTDPPESSLADCHAPTNVQRIVMRCLEKNPAARFQSTRDLTFALDACSSREGSAADTPAASASDNLASVLFATSKTREFFERHVETWNRHDPVALARDYTEDAVIVTQLGGRVQGREAIESFHRAVFQSFQPILRPDALLVNGDRVCRIGTSSGTFSEGFMGVRATGKSFKIQIVFIYQLRDGRIADEERFYDLATWLFEVGLR